MRAEGEGGRRKGRKMEGMGSRMERKKEGETEEDSEISVLVTRGNF